MKYMLILLLLISTNVYSNEEMAISETIKEQKRIDTERYLSKRRKAEMLKRQAILFQKTNSKTVVLKGFTNQNVDNPKNRVSDDILEKIRRAQK